MRVDSVVDMFLEEGMVRRRYVKGAGTYVVVRMTDGGLTNAQPRRSGVYERANEPSDLLSPSSKLMQTASCKSFGFAQDDARDVIAWRGIIAEEGSTGKNRMDSSREGQARLDKTGSEQLDAQQPQPIAPNNQHMHTSLTPIKHP
jgi:hypothetical protein